MSRYLDQLLDLVAVAEERPLEAWEAGRLRSQLRGLAVYRQQAGGLQSGLLETRRERDFLVATLAAITGQEPHALELETRAHVQRQASKPRQTPQEAA